MKMKRCAVLALSATLAVAMWATTVTTNDAAAWHVIPIPPVFVPPVIIPPVPVPAPIPPISPKPGPVGPVGGGGGAALAGGAAVVAGGLAVLTGAIVWCANNQPERDWRRDTWVDGRSDANPSYTPREEGCVVRKKKKVHHHRRHRRTAPAAASIWKYGK